MSEDDLVPAGRSERLRAILMRHFQPVRLEIVDDSASHAGHAGARAGGQTHFNVMMVADGFTGVSRVRRARLVHEVLAAEFAEGLHALSLVLRSPDEVQAFR
jgi:BolA protein